jgi:O-antigen/teichoic acid export membrane protein
MLPGPALSLAGRVVHSSEAAQAAFGLARLWLSYELRNLALFGLFLAGSGLVLLLSHRRRESAWQPLALALIVADLFVAGYGFNPAADPRLADFTPPSVAWLQRDRSPYRITSFGPANTLWPNTAMLFGIQDVRGYDSIIPRQYVETLNQIEDQLGMLLYNRIKPLDRPGSLDAPLLNLLGVKYVLSEDRLNHPGYRLVYDDEVLIYENERVLPRAFVVPRGQVLPRAQVLASLSHFDPTQVVLLEANGEQEVDATRNTQHAILSNSVPITRYTPNQVELDVSGAAGWLVLADSFFPGWKAYATVAGQPGEQELTIWRADGNFRAVKLPAGATHLRFTYSPMSLKLGLYLSFMAIVCLVLAAGYWLWGRLYQAESLDIQAREGEAVRRVARNSLAPMVTSLVNKVIDFAFAALMLRILGPTLAGRYYFAVVVIGYLDIFTNFGLNLLLIREVARDWVQANRYLSNTTALRLILWLASLPVLGVFLVVWRGLGNLPDDTAWAIGLLMLALVPSNLAAALSSLFNAFERMEYPAGITTLTTLLKVGLGVLVLLVGWGFVGLAGVSIVTNLVTAAILGRLAIRQFFRPRFEFDPGFVRRMVGVSYPLMLNHLLQTLFFKVDVTLLQPLKGDAVVGWYSTAYKWIDALLIIPAYFTMAIFPLMSRYAATAQDSLRRAYVLAVRLLVMIALPVAVLTTFIADELILILGGPEYLPHGAIALQIMIWFLPFSFVNGVTQYVLIALDQQRWITKTFALAAAFNIGANLLFIPHFSYPAAAAITIASEWVLLVPWTWNVRQHLGPLPWPAIVVRPALAAAGMALSLWLLRPVSLWIAVPAAGLVYLALLVALGTFNAEDRALIRRLLPERLKVGRLKV